MIVINPLNYKKKQSAWNRYIDWKYQQVCEYLKEAEESKNNKDTTSYIVNSELANLYNHIDERDYRSDKLSVKDYKDLRDFLADFYRKDVKNKPLERMRQDIHTIREAYKDHSIDELARKDPNSNYIYQQFMKYSEYPGTNIIEFKKKG